MIVFPLIRLVGLNAATASSRVETFPMFVRSRPSRNAQRRKLPMMKVGKKATYPTPMKEILRDGHVSEKTLTRLKIDREDGSTGSLPTSHLEKGVKSAGECAARRQLP
jgi:hypothetical protein